MLLIDDLLINLPVKGFLGIFKKIYDMAMEELYSEDKIQEELLHVSQLYESDQITKEEYQKKETALLERLTVIRQAHDGEQGRTTVREAKGGE